MAICVREAPGLVTSAPIKASRSKHKTPCRLPLLFLIKLYVFEHQRHTVSPFYWLFSYNFSKKRQVQHPGAYRKLMLHALLPIEENKNILLWNKQWWLKQNKPTSNQHHCCEADGACGCEEENFGTFLIPSALTWKATVACCSELLLVSCANRCPPSM